MTNLIFPLMTAYEIFVTVIIMFSACVSVSIFGVVAYFTLAYFFTKTNPEEDEKVVNQLKLSKGCPDLTKIDNLN